MRQIAILLASLVLSACVVRPDATQCLTAHLWMDPTVFYLESAPIEGFAAGNATIGMDSTKSRIHLSKSEIQSYVLSQIKWPAGNPQAKIEVGAERLGTLKGKLVFAIDAKFVQRIDQWHDPCYQGLTVIASLLGKPIGVIAGLPICQV